MKYAGILGWCAGLALIALFPNQSLLGFIGAPLFWGFSLALLFLLVRFVVRTWKSWTVGGRVLIGVGAVVLAAFFVQRLIPPGDTTEIKQTIETVATSTDPSYCDEKVTQRYLEQTTGAKPPFADDVCKNEAARPRADSISVSKIAIDHNRARAFMAARGGSFDGSTIVVQLVDQDGDWRLNQVVGFAKFDRPKFDQAYRRSLLEFGSATSAADCVLAKERRFSDTEIERAVLHDTHGFFAPIFVECDRHGFERSVRTGIADPELDFPPKAIDCAERRISTDTDAELVRLQVDLAAYGKLFLSCDREAVFDYYERELSADDDLDSEAVDCVVETFRGLPPAKFVRLSYDQDKYEALIEDCE